MKRGGPDPGSVRIIGGRWRGTRIAVPERRGLRPSADRVRETLFNWLTPYIGQARCLDLYAGSGVLGFEAVSRGAASTLALDHDPAATADLEALRQRLGAETIEVRNADAPTWLGGQPRPFDIVFVDPPFDSGLLQPTLTLLGGGWLAAGAVVYVEAARHKLEVVAPWRLLKSSATRHVDYALLSRTG